ncbi:unnamed protein product [Phytophthora lilii]|uniref:Unnamed protein product n=1 Tax=Phytophthora lilii TaxID=2077276 RepID=A0A9W6XLC7_9STRA|nr:unnamed protein product [Phytophthora lilii]
MSSFTTDTVSHVASSALRAPTASLGHGRISNVYMDKPLPSLASFANQEPCNAEKVVVARRRKPTKTPAATDIEIRRQRNRMHQARFIAKQKTTTARLVSGIHRLQEEIQELRLQRQFVSFAVPLRQTRWAVAVEYFRLFRNGLKDTMPQNGPDNALVPVESQVQRNFLQSTMAPDVASSMGFGVESILQNWRLISICHPDLDVQLTRLEDGPGDSLIAHERHFHCD